MPDYIQIKKKHEAAYAQSNKSYNWISAIRLVVFLLLSYFLYQSFSLTNGFYIMGVAMLTIGFVWCLRKHQQIALQRDISKTLIDINQDEIAYLNGDVIPYHDGNEYIDHRHFYTYDLDIFGPNSLYHHINRAYTYIGKQSLASLFSGKLAAEDILLNQEAIKELSVKIDWRQAFATHAILTHDTKENYDKLIAWSKGETQSISSFYTIAMYITPMLFVTSLILNYIYDGVYMQVSSLLFTINLMILFSQFKRIKQEIIASDYISKIISTYGIMLAMIENESFESAKMNEIKSQLVGNENASQALTKLSKLYADLQSIQNLMGVIIMNGTILHHIRSLKNVIDWKVNHAQFIETWLNLIGQVESLNSLANFAANNPDFCFPSLNDSYDITFEQLGHPLIKQKNRICNDVSLKQHPLIILTGSNMSGKSTFLRTLGVNMVLGGLGSVVCARFAHIHPLPVIVSMRQTDSLTDSESYFFAEVKRLKQIIEHLYTERSFVLLDEILKGTNSDDKQTGTIGVIKKLILHQAIGAVATHDLEVCKTTDLYPDYLVNRCFEVEITEGELSFDYKLREGICRNKSATFLMKKMDVI